jgi:hypothetical protein
LCGAAILPLTDPDAASPQTIRLPPPISLRGKLTVGAKNPSSWNNQLRVLAAYQGRGCLSDLLSLLVNAESDGRFALAGLTPGRYHIQAAMDDIWLSQSIEIDVAADGIRGASEPFTLDIGLPGEPSVIQCLDKNGEPQVGIEMFVVRPPGPFTDRLWPAKFISDGAGVVNVPPLEAGRHSYYFGNGKNKQTVEVKPLRPGYKPQPIELRTK